MTWAPKTVTYLFWQCSKGRAYLQQDTSLSKHTEGEALHIGVLDRGEAAQPSGV